MKNVPAGLKPHLYRLYSDPLQIYECYLEDPYDVPSHYFVANIEDITFGGQLYTALGIKRTPLKAEDGTILNEIELGLDNVDLAFKNLVASGGLNRKRVVVKLIFNSNLTLASDHIILLDGILDEPKGDNRWVTMTIKPFPLLERDYPRRIFQVGCNYVFGDEWCTVDRTLYKETYVVGGASTKTAINIVDDSHIDNYWTPGYIEFTSGDMEGVSRPVYASTNILLTLRVGLPDTPKEGDTFIIQKLCAKNPTACQAIFNNYYNYGGFPHVPKEPVL